MRGERFMGILPLRRGYGHIQVPGISLDENLVHQDRTSAVEVEQEHGRVERMRHGRHVVLEQIWIAGGGGHGMEEGYAGTACIGVEDDLG